MAVLNEEQEMLRDMARDWAKNESPVAEFRKVRASGEPQAYNADAYATMAQMGWACLLYTSPSPRDATLSRMPSSA